MISQKPLSHSPGTDPALSHKGEPRWPMASAVIAVIGLTVLLPQEVRAGPPWLLPGLECLVLVGLILGDPGRIDRRSAMLRRLSICLIGLLVFDALWSTAWLVKGLIEGGKLTESAGDLLDAGALVWISNCIAFALLYWQLDGGGPAERLHSGRRYPDLAFPQDLNPGIGPDDWRPAFVDYLYLGFTNATAFSPTDVMPLVPWAKLAMTLQSVVSLVVLGLVIARAVNVLT